MKKKFIINLILLIILNLLIKPFWIFGIDRTIQNQAGLSEYGTYYALLNLSLLFNIILDLGITNFNNTSISQDKSRLKDLFSNIVIIKGILFVLYFIISLVLIAILGYNNQYNLAIPLLVNQFLISLIFFLRSNISGMGMYTIDSILSVTDRLLMIGLCSVAFWLNYFNKENTIQTFVLIQTIGYAATAIITTAIILAQKDFKLVIPKQDKIKSVIRKSWPYALLILISTVYTRIDSILLERLLPDGSIQTGIYAQSYRLLDAANMFSYLFPTLLLPMFANQISLPKSQISLAKTAFTLLFVISISLALICALNSDSVISILYKHVDGSSSTVFKLLITSFIPLAITTIYGTLLTANGKLKELNYTAAITLGLNLGLNLILIPLYKAKGAAIACLCSQALSALIIAWIVQKEYSLKINYRKCLGSMLFIASCMLEILLIKNFTSNLILIFIASFGATTATAILTGLINIKEAIGLFIPKK